MPAPVVLKIPYISDEIDLYSDSKLPEGSSSDYGPKPPSSPYGKSKKQSPSIIQVPSFGSMPTSTQGWREEGPPRAFLMQPWITIKGTSPITSVVQQDSGWVDMSTFADAVFWIEVGEVTNPSGGSLSLVIESSPTFDETNFGPVAPPLQLVTASTTTNAPLPQIIRCVRTPSTVPLSRWTRWRLQSSGSGSFDATFRIRGSAGANNFVQPTMFPGCFLWLRADLGISLDSNGKVTQWTDSSGGPAVAINQQPNPPSYNTSPINGQASISFDGTLSQYLHFNPGIPWTGVISGVVHAFVVHRRSGAGAAGFWTIYRGGTAMPSAGNHIFDDAYSDLPAYDCGSPVISLNTPHVYEVTSNGTAWANLLNGIPQFSTNAGAFDSISFNGDIGFSSGAGTYYTGDWAEMVLYNRILTTGERGLLVDYFNGRYTLGAV